MNDSILTDVRYALRQLREFGDVWRAVDALERIEEALQQKAELVVVRCSTCGGLECVGCE